MKIIHRVVGIAGPPIRTPKWAALVLILGLVSCGTGSTPLASAAAKDVRARSVTAGIAMDKAGRTASAIEHARRVVGDIGIARIEVLQAEGDGLHGHVLLRISANVEERGYAPASTATACFRYDFNDASDSTQPHEVPCPHLPALALPAPSSEPTLPSDVVPRLTKALGSSNPEGAVRRAFDSATLRLQVLTEGGTLGVSVLAGRDECVFGRRLVGGRVEVWVVPRVLAQPGELGCEVRAAAHGDGKQPPH